MTWQTKVKIWRQIQIVLNAFEFTVETAMGLTICVYSYAFFASISIILTSRDDIIRFAVLNFAIVIYWLSSVFFYGGGCLHLWSQKMTLYDRKKRKIVVRRRKFLNRLARSLKPVTFGLTNGMFMTRETFAKLQDTLVQQTITFALYYREYEAQL